MALAPSRTTGGGVYLPFQRVSAVRLQLQPVHLHHHHHHHHSQHRSNTRPYTSFFIKDILGSKIGGVERDTESSPTASATDQPASTAATSPVSPTSPWSSPTSHPSPPPCKDIGFPAACDAPAAATAEKPLSPVVAIPCGVTKKDANGSPLSALEELANKTFTGLETSILRAAEAATVSGKRDPLHLFNRQPPRKKRKSRTAFNNQQIFELERRFMYQKYLTPADRDEIASVLGLSNAQVITWFQNRRAKQKRDMEELNMDVSATTVPAVAKKIPSEEIVMAAVSSAVAKSGFSSRLKEEDGDDICEDDDDDDDRLSTASEQHPCREQYSHRLVSSPSADHNNDRRGLIVELGEEEVEATKRGAEAAANSGERYIAGPVRRKSSETGIVAVAMDAVISSSSSCPTAAGVQGRRQAHDEEEEDNEVENMDCTTSPSSGFHSESEDK